MIAVIAVSPMRIAQAVLATLVIDDDAEDVIEVVCGVLELLELTLTPHDRDMIAALVRQAAYDETFESLSPELQARCARVVTPCRA